MKTVIRNGTVVNADHEGVADVLIDGEQIAAVGRIGELSDATEVDAAGCYVLPGLIDSHTHMSMPFQGTVSADDYDTGTRAAAAGGTTCIVDFARQREPGGLQSSLDEWQDRARGRAHVDYGFHMAITNADEATLADMERMVDQGVTSFKLFMAYKGELMVTDDLLLSALRNGRELGALIMVHAENGHVIDQLVREALAAGDTDPIHHALTRPESVEAEATARAARFAHHAGARLFVVHVSCDAAASEIAAWQARGADVTGETCLQYLTNSIDDLRRPGIEGARFVCSPPLREASNQEALWRCLRRGVLESVSTDHVAFTDEQKGRGLDDFSLIPNGLAGIQHRLVKLWDRGVLAGRVDRRGLVALCSTNVAHRFGLERKGAIAPGKDGDVVVFDPATPFRFSTETSHMNVDYDLFDGERSSGSVRHTFCRGTLVYDRGEIVTAPGHGRYVPRAAAATAPAGEAAAAGAGR